MALEIVFYTSCMVFSSIGIYLNLCYQRATHRSTVYPRYCGKNLRFLSIAHIVLACSNILATAACWMSRVNRTKKAESFFSTFLSLSRAIPQVTILWTTLERVMFKMSPVIRESPKFWHTALFRVVQIMASLITEVCIRTAFMNSEEQSKISLANAALEVANTEDLAIKSTLTTNYMFDYYHGGVLICCLVVALVMFNSARASHHRAGLLGGLRNDQKIQNLGGQMKFFKRSYVPLYFACLSDYFIQLIIKRGLDLEDSLIDQLYLNARCYLPIVYPLALIALNKNLRADYFANFILCRKARNLHKESKVKVIATRESQESIIANLKMIGILSDVDTGQNGPSAAGLAMMGMGGAMPTRPVSGMGQRVSIAKDPTSITSVVSMPKTSTASMGGGMMMFHTRPKNSVPSVGSVG
ncbi:hypothetical protein GCK72_003650 [Caenorhabditis remanei]|uniref:Uncharacterized protein n=1 Tax=Caenorhabditis remanei TaxID=31234 RepID=A0A6A5H948_CAERE|nr:hypothetical protein GCK72_003650 [Caenorhabditis remanei]KAF1763705.1 hypothetical protein GCK72_003650 [Caenorhabditis remanei]